MIHHFDILVGDMNQPISDVEKEFPTNVLVRGNDVGEQIDHGILSLASDWVIAQSIIDRYPIMSSMTDHAAVIMYLNN